MHPPCRLYSPPEEFKVIGDAVYAKCDGLDGQEDGRLADPRQCEFDPAVVLQQCIGGEAVGTCFSSEKIGALQTLYGGTRNAAGDLLVKGVLPGSEHMTGGWNTYYTGNKPQKHSVMDGSFEWMMLEDQPDFNYVEEFDFETDPPQLAYWAQAYNAVDPNLTDVKAMAQKMNVSRLL